MTDIRFDLKSVFKLWSPIRSFIVPKRLQSEGSTWTIRRVLKHPRTFIVTDLNAANVYICDGNATRLFWKIGERISNILETPNCLHTISDGESTLLNRRRQLLMNFRTGYSLSNKKLQDVALSNNDIHKYFAVC
jgi:hypothetical protein